MAGKGCALITDYYSEDQYAVSIKEDMAYQCLHSPKITEDKAQYAVSKETQYAVKMDNPNITMEEYIRLEEEKARRRAIVFNDTLTSEIALSCEPTVSSVNNDEIDFRISFDESDNDDCTNEFPAIVYNDAQTSKSDLLTEPILSPQHIDEFDLNGETSLSEYDEKEQNVLYINDLFPFNIIHPNDLKSEKDNDDNEIDVIQSSGDNVITTDVGAYAQGSNKLLETSHDTSNKFFKTENFIKELNVNIMAWNYLNDGMLLNLIMNLYVPFGIPFKPKFFYKNGSKLGQV
ncbi:hypothetical protein Tco_1275494 [Tanacetum coccineum]